MQALREAILQDGYGLGKDIVKVDMFLNHRLETGLLMDMGKAFYEHFSQKPVDMILTIETSGIAIAMTTAIEFGNLPVVFAKKHPESELPAIMDKGEDYYSPVYSYTHGQRNLVTIKKDYLPSGLNVLIVDDFLANGEAAYGLIDIAKQADCSIQGIGICVEKGFQPGGKGLREAGYDLKSLAVITAIKDGKLTLA